VFFLSPFVHNHHDNKMSIPIDWIPPKFGCVKLNEDCIVINHVTVAAACGGVTHAHLEFLFCLSLVTLLAHVVSLWWCYRLFLKVSNLAFEKGFRSIDIESILMMAVVLWF
jgi:hypothetical protein